MTFLAHGLGVVRAPETLSNTIGEKLCAGFTQQGLVLDEAGYLLKVRGEGLLGIPPMVLPTEDMGKANENLDILFLPLVHYHLISLPFLLSYTL
jgi:hypothetical protein